MDWILEFLLFAVLNDVLHDGLVICVWPTHWLAISEEEDSGVVLLDLSIHDEVDTSDQSVIHVCAALRFDFVDVFNQFFFVLICHFCEFVVDNDLRVE